MLTNCKPFKIAVSNDLNSAAEMPVKGRNGIMINQKLSFGNYYTSKINRSWTEGSEQNLGPMKVLWANYSQKRQSLHFTLNDNANNKAEVFCLSKVGAEDYTVGKNPNSIVNIMADVLGVGGRSESNFIVSIFLNKESNPWEIHLDNQSAQLNRKTYIGYLAQNKDNYYTIHPITALERDGKKGNILAGSVGFEIKDKTGKALAAVSMLDRGIVYLAETNPKEKFLLANTCAALLLQENIG
jgi:hypothetical protein